MADWPAAKERRQTPFYTKLSDRLGALRRPDGRPFWNVYVEDTGRVLYDGIERRANPEYDKGQEYGKGDRL